MSELPPEPPSPAAVEFQASADTWVLRYGGANDTVEVESGPLPSGDFTIYTQVTLLPSDPEAGVGLVLMGPEEPVVYVLASGTVPVHLKIEYVGDRADCYKSDDGGVTWTWLDGGPLERPVRAGLVLRYDDPLTPVWAQAARFRVLDGLLDPDVVTTVAVASMQEPVAREAPPQIMLASYVEPILHCVIGAQFGDLEYDVGKSVRWSMYFTDRHYILDINHGDTRYYVVNWSETFPEAQHGVTGTNFFYQPVNFRKEQFALADAAWKFGANDWVLFVDAHEGFSVDNRTLPDDWAMDPFKSYVYREVQRAVDAAKDRVCIPYFVFVRNANIQNIEYPIGDTGLSGADAPITSTQPISVPYYIPSQGLVRLAKVSALRNPSFPWNSLDTMAAADANVKVQIISYGYAHWNLQDIVPPATTVPPLDATNDEGWKMRKMLSLVRPITGLPYVDPWKDPSQDDQGLVGPTADVTNYNPIVPTVPVTPPAPNAACIGVRSPLYQTVMRLNLRDGVWYEGSDGQGALGNVPLAWNATTQAWEPSYPPEEWVKENFEVVTQ